MADKKNFILGAGEQLVQPMPPPPRQGGNPQPYTPDEARKRLAPKLRETAMSFRRVPELALPNGEAVAKLTLHPQFLSKSAFPSDVLKEAGFRAIGSMATRTLPDAVDRKTERREEATACYFVAGSVRAFDEFVSKMDQGSSALRPSSLDELPSIETIDPMMPTDRLAPSATIQRSEPLECVLHAGADRSGQNILEAFVAYAESLDIKVDPSQLLRVAGLSFLSVQGDPESIEKLAWFSFLRQVRSMPRMRPLFPQTVTRSFLSSPVEISGEPPPDEGLRVAVFDTALPPSHGLAHWVNYIDHGAVPFREEGERLHGLCVTSAATLGPLNGVKGLQSPYFIDHHGVLGYDPVGSNYHAQLDAIQKAVRSNKYPLINFSFGPSYPVMDDHPDPFTVMLDELLADGECVAFVAVGNDGDGTDELLTRVQPPSDSVNAVSVGATDTRQSSWQKADYSCQGPGRPGCQVKPDVVNFGGSADEPFGCVGPDGLRYDTGGTSFATPSTMRMAGEILAAMGSQVTPVATRALLIHTSRNDTHDSRHVGHGLLSGDLDSIITCDDTEVKVLYQGFLEPGKYTRHTLPSPETFSGNVEIEATLCFASAIDPSFPASYLQSGVECTFRPHTDKYGTYVDKNGVVQQSTNAKTDAFFSQKNVYGESKDRGDAHRWDTVLRSKITKRATSLKDPVIELHYNRRGEGRPAEGVEAVKIPYALVMTIRCRSMVDLYNQVVARYGPFLRVLAPRAEIQIRR